MWDHTLGYIYYITYHYFCLAWKYFPNRKLSWDTSSSGPYKSSYQGKSTEGLSNQQRIVGHQGLLLLLAHNATSAEVLWRLGKHAGDVITTQIQTGYFDQVAIE
jgi:hypothetical protein